jgi:hypothetical protein
LAQLGKSPAGRPTESTEVPEMSEPRVVWRDERNHLPSTSIAACPDCTAGTVGSLIGGRWGTRILIERAGRGVRCGRCHALAAYIVTDPGGGRMTRQAPDTRRDSEGERQA